MVKTASNRAHIRPAVAAAMAVALFVSACGSTGEADPVVAAEPVEDSAAGALTTVSGSQIEINSLEGSDTILWFWAPW